MEAEPGHYWNCFNYFLFVPQRKLLQPEEETQEEKQFRAIYQQIAGEVSAQREETSIRQWSEDDSNLIMFSLNWHRTGVNECVYLS